MRVSVRVRVGVRFRVSVRGRGRVRDRFTGRVLSVSRGASLRAWARYPYP